MRVILIFLIVCFKLQTASAWTDLGGNIRGIVTNQESGQVIRGATIKLIPFDSRNDRFIEKSFSQDAGEFLFNDIEPGLYNLECNAFGFKTTRLIGIQVREDRTKLAYFKMERGSAAEINEVYTYAALEAKQKTTTQTSATNEESLEDAPATIYIITAEDIETKGYMSLNEVLEHIPEFEIQYRNNPEGNNVISARGIHDNNKLLILKDGHRYNSMVNTQYTLMENYGIRYADRIEIILGPASALYGADAYMGVVNIISKKGSEARAASLTGSYGNYNTTSNSFHVGWGNDKISFALDAGFFYTEGANLNDLYKNKFYFYNQTYLTKGLISANPFAQNQTTQTLPIKPFNLERQAIYVNGRFDYKKFNFSISMNQDQHSSSIGTNPMYSPYWKSSKFGKYILNLSIRQDYAFKKNSKWSTTSEITGSIVRLNPNSNFVNALSSYKKSYRAGVDNGIRLQQIVNYKPHQKHSITAGVVLQHSMSLPQTSNLPNNINTINKINLFSRINTTKQDIYYLGTNFRDSSNNSLKIYQNFYYLRRWIGAAFAEYRGNIKNKLLITLGIRYDQIFDVSEYSSTTPKPIYSYSNITPRLGLVYKPLKNLNFKFFFGQGFLQPSPDLKYSHFGFFHPTIDSNSITGPFWRVPNQNLEPEKVQSLEFSSRYSKGDFSIGVNSYYNEILNPITYNLSFSDSTQLTFLGVPIDIQETPINRKEHTKIYGATLALAYRLVYGKEEQLKIKFRASYSYVNGKASGLSNIPYTAMHTAKARILLKYLNFSINNSLLFRSKSYNNSFTINNANNEFQTSNPPFFVWNIFARYKILDKKKFSLSVFVKINNVLDNRYYNVTDDSSIAFGTSPQDPIRFLVGTSIKFGRKR